LKYVSIQVPYADWASNDRAAARYIASLQANSVRTARKLTRLYLYSPCDRTVNNTMHSTKLAYTKPSQGLTACHVAMQKHYLSE